MPSTSFWNSNTLLAITTLLVGLSAYFIYWRQGVDRKKDAANIILLEIKNAETHLADAKETITSDNVLPETVFAMQTSSWEKYNYLFIRDFKENEWADINKFYEKCRQYDEAVNYHNTFFRKNEEQTRINLHAALRDYISTYVEDLKPQDKADGNPETEKEKADRIKKSSEVLSGSLQDFAKNYMAIITTNGSDYFYSPKKAYENGQAIINTIKIDLSTSTIGIKLDKIINQNIRMRIFERIMGVKTN